MPKAKAIKKESAKKEESLPVIYKSYAVVMEDEFGQVTYTFLSKRKRDEFYVQLNKR